MTGFRYSDILVHRLLAVCIGADASYPELLEKHKTQVNFGIVLTIECVLLYCKI